MRLVAVALVALVAGFGGGYAAGDNNHPAKVVKAKKAKTTTDPYAPFFK